MVKFQLTSAVACPFRMDGGLRSAIKAGLVSDTGRRTMAGSYLPWKQEFSINSIDGGLQCGVDGCSLPNQGSTKI